MVARIVLLCCLTLLATAACGGSDSPAQPTPTAPTPTDVAGGAPTPAASSGIEIASPGDGSTTTAFVALEVAVAGVTLHATSPGGAHWHTIVDGEASLEPQTGTEAVIGALAAGPHTIAVALYLNRDDATPIALDEISVVVE